MYTLLLTTRGRRSGQLRRTALIYGRDGDRYLVVASVGGSARHPAWYLNLTEHPEVEVQVGAERFAATARTAGPEEKPRLWSLMTAIWPAYEDYQRKTSPRHPGGDPGAVLTPSTAADTGAVGGVDNRRRRFRGWATAPPPGGSDHPGRRPGRSGYAPAPGGPVPGPGVRRGRGRGWCGQRGRGRGWRGWGGGGG